MCSSFWLYLKTQESVTSSCRSKARSCCTKVHPYHRDIQNIHGLGWARSHASAGGYPSLVISNRSRGGGSPTCVASVAQAIYRHATCRHGRSAVGCSRSPNITSSMGRDIFGMRSESRRDVGSHQEIGEAGRALGQDLDPLLSQHERPQASRSASAAHDRLCSSSHDDSRFRLYCSRSPGAPAVDLRHTIQPRARAATLARFGQSGLIPT
jgi:hypothetical protein